MSKKRRKKAENFVNLLPDNRPRFCGFILNTKNINCLWKWDTLEDVKFEQKYGSKKE